jgi:hypothetical protein
MTVERNESGTIPLLATGANMMATAVTENPTIPRKENDLKL